MKLAKRIALATLCVAGFATPVFAADPLPSEERLEGHLPAREEVRTAAISGGRRAERRRRPTFKPEMNGSARRGGSPGSYFPMDWSLFRNWTRSGSGNSALFAAFR